MGSCAPARWSRKLPKAGVTTLALTDHDAVAGVPEAAAKPARLGIEMVPAVEMSCVHEYAEDLHICGYWVDLEKIAPACERAQGERRERAGEIVENLRREGFELTLEDAIREAGDADSIGRPHIAKAAGATGDLGPFFEEYLVPGAKAFVPRRWPDAAQAIELIREAGGAAVIAHPYWDISDPGEVDDLIRSLAPDGVETFYPPHTREQTAHLLGLCEELGLVPTASSDYHGPTHKTFAKFGAYDTYGLGEPQVPAKLRRRNAGARTSPPTPLYVTAAGGGGGQLRGPLESPVLPSRRRRMQPRGATPAARRVRQPCFEGNRLDERQLGEQAEVCRSCSARAQLGVRGLVGCRRRSGR